MNEKAKKLKFVAEKYGFMARSLGNTTALFCKDTDGHNRK